MSEYSRDGSHVYDGLRPLNTTPIQGLNPSRSKPVEVKAVLPTDPQVRKEAPIISGVLDYFPLAIAEVARVSKAGNDQHNLGQALHWERGKSQDHADCIGRHLTDRGLRDSDGQRHSSKLAWRALALLEEEMEAEGGPMGRASWVENKQEVTDVKGISIDSLRTHKWTGNAKCWKYHENTDLYCTFQKGHSGNHECMALDCGGNGVGPVLPQWK